MIEIHARGSSTYFRGLGADLTDNGMYSVLVRKRRAKYLARLGQASQTLRCPAI